MFKTGWSLSLLRVCRPAVCFDESIKTVRDTQIRRRPLVLLMVLKRTFLHIYVMEKANLPREVRLSLSGKVNETTRRRIRPWMSFAKKEPLCIYPTPLRHRAINPNPLKKVKGCGTPPEARGMYPVVEHTRTKHAARNHSQSRAPHHWSQCNATKKESVVFILRLTRVRMWHRAGRKDEA